MSTFQQSDRTTSVALALPEHAGAGTVELLSVKEARIADRLAKRVMKEVTHGATTVEVKGGTLGVLRTAHKPEVYALMAEKLGTEQVTAEVYGHEAGYTDSRVRHVVNILAVNDEPTAASRFGSQPSATPRFDDPKFTQVYPPAPHR